MGIFFEDSGEDVEFLLNICKAGTEDWNDRYSSTCGYRIDVKVSAIEVISRLGEKILKPDDRPCAFPDFPSAFKRAAAWMLSFCIHPLLIVLKEESDGSTIRHTVYGDAARPFVAEFVVESLPIVLSALDAQSGDSWVPLDGWKGFLTPEYKNELITYFLWQGDSSFRFEIGKGGSYDWPNLESTVLLLSLALEASYGKVEP